MQDQDRVSKNLATWFGCGNSPIAPGTVGSIATLPLHIALKWLGPAPYLLGTLVAVGAGVWASERTAAALGEKDPQRVVIDEVAGTLIAMGLCRGHGLGAELLSLVAFRIFDVLKPGIIDKAQRLEPKGVGIMADDVLAGLAAGLLTRLLTSRKR